MDWLLYIAPRCWCVNVCVLGAPGMEWSLSEWTCHHLVSSVPWKAFGSISTLTMMMLLTDDK